MTSRAMSADPTIFPNIQRFYEQQRGDILQVKNYVQNYCTLGDAFGVLLSGLKPQYEQGRDAATTAMQNIADMLDGLGTQVEGCHQDYEDSEAANLKRIAELEAMLEALTNAKGTTTGGGGGGYGPGGGGGYTGPSLDATAPAPTGPDDPIEIVVGDGGVVIINNGDDNDNTVVTGDDSEASDSDSFSGDDSGADDDTSTGDSETENDSAAVGDENSTGSDVGDESIVDGGGSGGGSGAPGSDTSGTEAPDAYGSTEGVGTTPAVDPQAVAAENARQSELYNQVWEEQAAADPLGRSADELRLAWESRDSIELDQDAEGITALGYGEGAAETLQPVPVNFQLVTSDFAPTTVSDSSTLIGATR